MLFDKFVVTRASSNTYIKGLLNLENRTKTDKIKTVVGHKADREDFHFEFILPSSINCLGREYWLFENSDINAEA